MPLEHSPELGNLILGFMRGIWWSAHDHYRNAEDFVIMLGPETWDLFEGPLRLIERFTPTDVVVPPGTPPPLSFRGTPVIKEPFATRNYVNVISRATYDRASAEARPQQTGLPNPTGIPTWPEA